MGRVRSAKRFKAKANATIKTMNGNRRILGSFSMGVLSGGGGGGGKVGVKETMQRCKA